MKNFIKYFKSTSGLTSLVKSANSTKTALFNLLRLKAHLLRCVILSTAVTASIVPVIDIVSGSKNISQRANSIQKPNRISQRANSIQKPNRISQRANSIQKPNRISQRPNANANAFSNANTNSAIFRSSNLPVAFNPIPTTTTQVDVGGIVASALSLNSSNPTTGNYNFAGNSGKVNKGGIVLIAARITNRNVSPGADAQVTLNLGGAVKIQVTQKSLDTLVQNGGATQDDGGFLYLTEQAASDLNTTVINNTGLVKAQTLVRNAAGQMALMDSVSNNQLIVDNILDTSVLNNSAVASIGNSTDGIFNTNAPQLAAETGPSFSSINSPSSLLLIDGGIRLSSSDNDSGALQNIATASAPNGSDNVDSLIGNSTGNIFSAYAPQLVANAEQINTNSPPSLLVIDGGIRLSSSDNDSGPLQNIAVASAPNGSDNVDSLIGNSTGNIFNTYTPQLAVAKTAALEVFALLNKSGQ